MDREKAAAVPNLTASRICADSKEQFEIYCQRGLNDVESDYLLLHGSHFKYHANASPHPLRGGLHRELFVVALIDKGMWA